jgi:hypothetical protein
MNSQIKTINNFWKPPGGKMKLQKSIISTYKTLYPKDTLKDISDRTGIHFTRVFRLLKGKEMKLKEFSAFENACFEKNSKSKTSYFFNLAKKCTEILDLEKLEELSDEMHDRLEISKIMKSSLIDLAAMRSL